MHTPWPVQRNAASVLVLLQLARDLGVTASVALAGTSLFARELAADRPIAALSELRLIGNLIDVLPDHPTLGLLAGERYRVSTYGAWGSALLGCASGRQATELGLRYLELTYAFTHICLHEENDLAMLTFADTALAAPEQAMVVQRDMRATWVLMQEVLGPDIRLRQVRFRQSDRNRAADFEGAFVAPVAFSASENRMIFDRGVLDQALPMANPALVAACEAQCQRLLTQYRWQDGLSSQVLRLLMEQPERLGDMGAVAEQLNLSVRTLHRRLAAEGSSFRVLQEGLRRQLATEWLSLPGASQTDIAARLGYSDASNFAHAFRRWTGTTPGRHAHDSVTQDLTW